MLAVGILNGDGDVVARSFLLEQTLAHQIGSGQTKRCQKVSIRLMACKIEQLHLGAEQSEVGTDPRRFDSLHHTQ